MSIYNYSTTDASNTTVGGANVAEGCSPGNVNDALRGLAADCKQLVNDISGRLAASGTNSITVTTQSGISALAEGLIVGFEAANTNTGATTFAPNGLAAQDVKQYVGGTLRALVGGEIVAGNRYLVSYDATNSDWILLNPTPVPVAFTVHKGGSSQGSISASTYTLVTFGTEGTDTHSYFASNRYTPLIAGQYEISANLTYSGGLVDQAVFKCAVYKNGVISRESQTHASGTSNISVGLGCIVEMDGVDDYLEIYAYGSGAGSKTVDGASEATWFSGHRLT
jgi:hypothetical protein